MCDLHFSNSNLPLLVYVFVCVSVCVCVCVSEREKQREIGLTGLPTVASRTGVVPQLPHIHSMQHMCAQ